MQLITFSRSDPLEVSYFRMGKLFLRFIGIWPLDRLNLTTVLILLSNMGIFVTAIIGEIRFTWLFRREPIEALTAICPCLTRLVTLMKIMIILTNRKEFAGLIDALYQHLRKDTKDIRKNALIGGVSFFTSMWYALIYFCALVTNCFYTFNPLIVWVYRRLTGERDIWVSLPFSASLPYKDMTQLQDKTLYSFVYCLLTYSGIITITGFSGIDGAFMCICMYISASYRCLQEDFKQTFKKHTKTRLSTIVTRNDLLYKDLAVLAKRHQNLIAIFNRFNRLYKFMIFGHFTFASTVLGVVLINLILAPGISKMVYVSYAMGAGMQLYSYCYGAESLNESCLDLSEALYFCDWQTCDKRVKNLILFVMAKSQRGSRLVVPFFSPSLSLFAAIMRTSGSYFTLLQAVL